MTNYIARQVVLMIAAMLALSACVAYVPPPAPPPPSTTERAYNAVVAAMAENGVRVGEANPATGTVTGSRGNISVTATVTPRPDGSAQIELRTKGNISEDPTLLNRITESYNNRMGR
jgi:hypothetical protein